MRSNSSEKSLPKSNVRKISLIVSSNLRSAIAKDFNSVSWLKQQQQAWNTFSEEHLVEYRL